jgi:hypothetical protein
MNLAHIEAASVGRSAEGVSRAPPLALEGREPGRAA